MTPKPRWLKWIRLYERGRVTAAEFTNTVLEEINADNVDEVFRVIKPETLKVIQDVVLHCPADDDEVAWSQPLRGTSAWPRCSEDELEAITRKSDCRYRDGVKVFRRQLTNKFA
jgi:hypothetical protein